jgi:hypothetical protein
VSPSLFSIAFGNANEIIGRAVFGVPALIFDALIVGIIYYLIKERIQEQREDVGSDE